LLAPVASLYSSEDNLNYLNAPENHQQQKAHSPFRIPEPFQTINTQLKSTSNFNLNAQQQQQQPILAKPSSKLFFGSLPHRQTLSAVPHNGAQSPSCGHHNAGQELCYLCHQKTRRNVPIYLNEERKQKNDEEEQLLMQYQTFKNSEKQIKEEMDQAQRKDERARMDAFNLGMAEAIKAKKMERPKTSDMSVS
jgi:hypothetical protein